MGAPAQPVSNKMRKTTKLIAYFFDLLRLGPTRNFMRQIIDRAMGKSNGEDDGTFPWLGGKA